MRRRGKTKPKRILDVMYDYTIPEEVRKKAWQLFKDGHLPRFYKPEYVSWKSLFID